MGAGASITKEAIAQIAQVPLKKLPEAVEEAVYIHEKFPLIIDPSEQASRFLKYQSGAFVNYDDPIQGQKKSLNRALVASMQNGRTFSLKIPDLQKIKEDIFEPKTFPKVVIDRNAFFADEVWQSVLKPNLGDPLPEDASISPEFIFILVTVQEYVPAELQSKMHIIRVLDPAKQEENNGQSSVSSGDAGMDQIASLFGANEIIR
jgi:hypothetical protein